ncbi:MAG: BrnT family toxin [Pyrinomonadaceae bacterium]|nr:BrnT family toxin [Pyrinomonadaceae bacterium]
MEFEWDENKNLANIKNHEGVSFQDAVKVFHDIWSIEDFDESHSAVEERFSVIGLVEYTLLRVVFTYRETEAGEQIIRIISAWKATSRDKEIYEKSRNRFDI